MEPLSPLAIYLLIFGCFAINFALRFAPLAILSRVDIPRPVMRWLSYIPVAIMGALVAVEVLIPALDAAFFAHAVSAGAESGAGGAGTAGAAAQEPATRIPLYMNPGIYGALLSMAVYYYTKSFIGATVSGVALFALLQWVFGF